MNAPPTPPLEPSEIPEVELVEPPAAEAEAPPAVDPTPAAEVQAEQPPQSPAPTPVVPADNTIYHNVFPTLVSLAVDGNYRELIHRAKFYDSEAGLAIVIMLEFPLDLVNTVVGRQRRSKIPACNTACPFLPHSRRSVSSY